MEYNKSIYSCKVYNCRDQTRGGFTIPRPLCSLLGELSQTLTTRLILLINQDYSKNLSTITITVNVPN